MRWNPAGRRALVREACCIINATNAPHREREVMAAAHVVIENVSTFESGIAIHLKVAISEFTIEIGMPSDGISYRWRIRNSRRRGIYLQPLQRVDSASF
ncbi:hypothetical protein [Bradyrhizobium sp. USDA 3364]